MTNPVRDVPRGGTASFTGRVGGKTQLVKPRLRVDIADDNGTGGTGRSRVAPGDFTKGFEPPRALKPRRARA